MPSRAFLLVLLTTVALSVGCSSADGVNPSNPDASSASPKDAASADGARSDGGGAHEGGSSGDSGKTSDGETDTGSADAGPASDHDNAGIGVPESGTGEGGVAPQADAATDSGADALPE